MDLNRHADFDERNAILATFVLFLSSVGMCLLNHQGLALTVPVAVVTALAVYRAATVHSYDVETVIQSNLLLTCGAIIAGGLWYLFPRPGAARVFGALIGALTLMAIVPLFEELLSTRRTAAQKAPHPAESAEPRSPTPHTPPAL